MSSIPKPIRTHDASPPAGPYSQAVKANGLVFVSGQIPADKNGDVITGSIEECTEAVFKNLEAVLHAAGSSPNRVLKTTVFLADMNDFAAMNSVYEKHFEGFKPARSCVAVKTLPKGVQVEIECIALEDSLPGKVLGRAASDEAVEE
ncbi:YjgF-like protein [Ascodesmis nigricans]|uniref:YjgF-like protein n=1 Tax=Ascodesmis nigricans TaxID=341454 RepID=A0A4S2N1J3_9PEZI|nr:YjgF-like protein [Ascodesmis nigricans]